MLVGAVIRVEPGSDDAVRDRLDRLDGVETLPEARPGKLGIMIEASHPNDAHRILTEAVADTKGVLAAWPVSAWYDETEAGADVAPIRETGERHARFTA